MLLSGRALDEALDLISALKAREEGWRVDWDGGSEHRDCWVALNFYLKGCSEEPLMDARVRRGRKWIHVHFFFYLGDRVLGFQTRASHMLGK